MKELQAESNFTKLMVVNEYLKTMDFGAVWEQYLTECGVPVCYYDKVVEYEQKVLLKRA